MLDKLRELYYRRRFGEENGRFLTEAHTLLSKLAHPEDDGPARKHIEWLQTLPEGDRLEGLRLYSAWTQIVNAKELGVRVRGRITVLLWSLDSMRTQLQVDDAFSKLSGLGRGKTDIKSVKKDLANREALIEKLVAYDSYLTEWIRRAEEEHAAGWEAFSKRCPPTFHDELKAAFSSNAEQTLAAMDNVEPEGPTT
jgi:hypothetical protein